MTAYNVLTEDQYGRQIKPVLFNTAKDGSGTWYIAIVDSDGHLQIDALSITAGTNLIGKVSIDQVTANANEVVLKASTANVGKVGHDATGIGHGVTTVPTAGVDVVLAASTTCKILIIQAQTDNTGVIAIGGSGVDATIATGTGVALYAGEVIPLELDNLADVYIDATVSTDGVRYTYLT